MVFVYNYHSLIDKITIFVDIKAGNLFVIRCDCHCIVQ